MLFWSILGQFLVSDPFLIFEGGGCYHTHRLPPPSYGLNLFIGWCILQRHTRIHELLGDRGDLKSVFHQRKIKNAKNRLCLKTFIACYRCVGITFGERLFACNAISILVYIGILIHLKVLTLIKVQKFKPRIHTNHLPLTNTNLVFPHNILCKSIWYY
jgi:hypothetical protein